MTAVEASTTAVVATTIAVAAMMTAVVATMTAVVGLAVGVVPGVAVEGLRARGASASPACPPLDHGKT
jgi:hypothetical protein